MHLGPRWMVCLLADILCALSVRAGSVGRKIERRDRSFRVNLSMCDDPDAGRIVDGSTAFSIFSGLVFL